jgi:hypothetical protein
MAIAVWAFAWSARPTYAEEVISMEKLEVYLDGQALALGPAAGQINGETWVPLHGFSRAVGAEVKEVGGGLAVCREELCIPLAPEDQRVQEGQPYVRLAAIGSPLDLEWTLAPGRLRVRSAGQAIGLGIGEVPPSFALPDLFTGEMVSSSAFRGKKAVFYLWASW